MSTIKTDLLLIKKLLALKEIIDAGQIQSAAERNGLKHSNLSRLISELEDEMNTTLLYRTINGVEPTHTARLLCENVEKLRKQLNLITSSYLKPDEAKEMLTVFIGSGVGGSSLLRELSSFYAKNPNIRLNIATDRRLSLNKIDFAILNSASRTVQPNVSVLFKVTGLMHFYASKTYLQAKGKPKDLDDLLENHNLCLQQTYLNETLSYYILNNAKHIDTTADTEMVIFLLTQAGDGVALLHEWTAKADTDLVLLDYIAPPIKHEFYGVTQPTLVNTPKIKSLTQFIRELCIKHNTEFIATE